MNAELVKLETHGIHDELVYSSFLKSYEIVALSDSVPEALIKFPDRILFAEDRIFVVDRFGNKVLMFDREGNFLKSTASMTGKGHNEYIRLMMPPWIRKAGRFTCTVMRLTKSWCSTST